MTRFIVLVAAVLVALSAPADASRLPTGSEKRAIARDWAKGTRADCLVVYVSDVSSKWASLTWGGLKRGESVRQFSRRCSGAANGLAIMNKRNGKWRYIADAGSDSPADCPFSRVPTRVAADLKACLAPERECESPDLMAVLFAPDATSCEMALQVGIAYEAATDGQYSTEFIHLRVKDPGDGRAYSLTCAASGETAVACDSRRHRVSLRY